MIRAAALASCLAATPAAALDLPANADKTAEEVEAPASYALPVGPWTADGGLPTERVEGAVVRQAWRIPSGRLTTLQILAPLREELRAEGYDIRLDCETEGCGGFDFRLGIEVIPPPEMAIDLADFRFLSALRETEAGREAIGLLVSRTERAGYVQVTQVTPGESPAPAASAPATGRATGPLAERLETQGRAVLSDLTFETGSSDLGDGDYASLAEIAAYLAATPGVRIALVGHTDTTGNLDTNIALSRRRAQSVLERLVSDHGAPRARLDAEGMGYLAPLASNLTEAGREANRRVEAVLLPGE